MTDLEFARWFLRMRRMDCAVAVFAHVLIAFSGYWVWKALLTQDDWLTLVTHTLCVVMNFHTAVSCLSRIYHPRDRHFAELARRIVKEAADEMH